MTDAELAIVVKLKDMFSSQLDKIVASTDKSTTKMVSSWKKLTSAIDIAKTTVVGWLTGKVATFATEMVQLGAKVDRTSVAFGTLAKGIRLDTTEAIAGLRAAASGTISDLELMTVANKAMLTGVAKSSEELERLVSTGRKLGGAMGLSSQEGIERLTQGLVSQQTESLRSIGIMINLESAAKKLGITLSDLTAEERQSFFSQEVWKVAAERMKTLGDNTSSVSTNVARMGAAWDNAKNKLAEFMAQAFAEKEPGKTWLESIFESAGRAGSMGGGAGTYGAGVAPPAARPAGPGVRVGPTVEEADRMRRIEAMRAEFRKETKGYSNESFGLKKSQTDRPEIIETVISQSDQLWAALGEGVSDYYRHVSDTMVLVGDAVYRSLQNIEQNIGEVFFDTMMGKMKTFKEYLRAFVTDIARTLSQMMARNAMAGLISSIGSSIGGLFGSTVGGSPGGGGGAAGMAGESDNMFAYGGITTGTSIAGERGPEAVVPLPGSRSIPVEMRGGGGGGNVTYIINAIDTQSFAAALMGNKASIHRIVTEGLGMDTQLRAAARAV
jgi:hypothetical protein